MAEKTCEALLYAAESGSLQGVKAALKAGADIDYADPANVITGGRHTALFIASFLGHVDMVRLLLRKGASVTKRTAVSSFAPLHEAAKQGHTEVVELLVHHGATLDIQDGLQITPLMIACMYKKIDTVRQLIELGARVDLADRTGDTAETFCDWDIVGEVGDRDSKKMKKLIQEAMETKLLRCCNPKCGKPGYRSTLKLCGQCKLTRYCSRDCQKQHWSVGHKKCCGHDAYTDEGPMLLKLVELMKEYNSSGSVSGNIL